jgi:hypothetical protein
MTTWLFLIKVNSVPLSIDSILTSERGRQIVRLLLLSIPPDGLQIRAKLH